MKSLSIVLLCLILFSCTDRKDTPKKKPKVISKVRFETEAINKNYIPIETREAKACQLLAAYPESIDSIKSNVRLWMVDDSCSFTIMDTLAADYIRTGDLKYLICLDSIARYSDGAVTEYLCGVIIDVFEKRFEDFFKYIYDYLIYYHENHVFTHFIFFYELDSFDHFPEKRLQLYRDFKKKYKKLARKHNLNEIETDYLLSLFIHYAMD